MRGDGKNRQKNAHYPRLYRHVDEKINVGSRISFDRRRRFGPQNEVFGCSYRMFTTSCIKNILIVSCRIIYE